MSRLRMAVVGTGALGRHHARILAGLDDVELVAVVDTDPQRAEEVAARHGCRPLTDFAPLFDTVDAVTVAVPTSAHRRVAGEFLKRGIPVLVEKPLAATAREAAELVELAEDGKTLLAVGHVERFNPAVVAAFRTCLPPVGAPPRYIRAERLSPFPFRCLDVGVVLDLMVHDLDLLLELVPMPITRIEAMGVALMGGAEDIVQARLRFANGTIADLVASRVHPAAQRTMQIWSADGATTIDFAARRVIRFRAGDRLRFGPSPLECAQRRGADIEAMKKDVFGSWIAVDHPSVANTDPLTDELAQFVECVRTGSAPTVDGHRGRRCVEVADRIVAALKTPSGQIPDVRHPLFGEVQTPSLREAG